MGFMTVSTASIPSRCTATPPPSQMLLTYPGPYGPQQTFISQAAVLFTYSPDNRKYGMFIGGKSETSDFGSDFTGFTQVLSDRMFPPYWKVSYDPTENTSANYTYKLQLPSTFHVISPLNGCTYTYRMVSGPAFGGMKPSFCAPGKEADCPFSCPSGKYKATVTAGSGASSTGYICALCPAGTTSTKDSSSCQPCPGATAAAAVGSSSCRACTPPYKPSPTKSACAMCSQNGMSLPGVRTSCPWGTALHCPQGTFPTTNNECIGGNSGKLCVAKSLAPPDGPAAKGPICSADPSSGKAVFGGAILQLLSSNTNKPGCKARVAPLAKWLQGKSTYMGFNLTVPYPNYRYNDGTTGVQWQVLGSLEGSNLGELAIRWWEGQGCGNDHSDGVPPGPQPGLSVAGTALGMLVGMGRGDAMGPG
jgi:hypothetical protein